MDRKSTSLTEMDKNAAPTETRSTQEATVGRKSTSPLPPPPAARNHKRRLAILVGAVVLALVAAVIVYYVRFIAPYESTDDAFIEGHVTIVSPRVSGPVVRLLVQDNQEVKEGDPLFEIDPRDYDTKLAQTRADLAAAHSRLEQAKAQVAVDEAKAAQQLAAVTAAEAEARRAGADLQRYQSVESRAVSRTQLDLERTQAESTAASLEVAREQAKAAAAQVGLSRAKIETAAAGVQQAEAKMEQAQLDVSYTKVAAPVDGRVTRRFVEKGAYVQTGESLLALVPTNVWVVANFKEHSWGACARASPFGFGWMPIPSGTSKERWTACRLAQARGSVCCRPRMRWAITSRLCNAFQSRLSLMNRWIPKWTSPRACRWSRR